MCQKVTISTEKESYIINTTKVVVKFSKQKIRLKVNLHNYFFSHTYRNPSKLNLCASSDQKG